MLSMTRIWYVVVSFGCYKKVDLSYSHAEVLEVWRYIDRSLFFYIYSIIVNGHNFNYFYSFIYLLSNHLFTGTFLSIYSFWYFFYYCSFFNITFIYLLVLLFIALNIHLLQILGYVSSHRHYFVLWNSICQ